MTGELTDAEKCKLPGMSTGGEGTEGGVVGLTLLDNAETAVAGDPAGQHWDVDSDAGCKSVRERQCDVCQTKTRTKMFIVSDMDRGSLSGRELGRPRMGDQG